VVKKLKYNEKRAELYYVNNFFVENRKWKLKILYLPFWLCARKINIAFASKKGIKITKFVLDKIQITNIGFLEMTIFEMYK
jgi:hypothetical protein